MYLEGWGGRTVWEGWGSAVRCYKSKGWAHGGGTLKTASPWWGCPGNQRSACASYDVWEMSGTDSRSGNEESESEQGRKASLETGSGSSYAEPGREGKERRRGWRIDLV